MARSEAAASAVGLVVMMALVQGSMAALHVVGGPVGWQLDTLHNPNFYQDWVRSNKPFYSTDSLEFQWIDPDSVLQVNYADFIACNTAHPIQSWPGNFGGSVTTMMFSLSDYKRHTVYFISGFEHNCGAGQKFYIDILE